MSYVSETLEKSKAEVASQLDAATAACGDSVHEHYDGAFLGQPSPASIVNDPTTSCLHCRRWQLWRRYNQILNDEIEDGCADLYQWALLDNVTPRERAAVIQQCEKNLEAAALANFDMDLSVTDVSPRQRLEVGAAYERAKRELDIACYIPRGRKVPHGKAH